MYTKDFQAKELTGDIAREITYSVAVEDTIELYVNRIHAVAILATPEKLKELAIGYLICEGIVDSPDDILDFSIDGNIIHTFITSSDDFDVWRELRSSGCVGAKWDENEDVTVMSGTTFNPEAIKKSLGFLESEIYKKTRGTHAACLINIEGECVLKAVDVGRHNAFDKVVGSAYFEKIDLGNHFILSTGRQSAGMVMKAARAGITLIATKTAPLNSGIEAAERVGICLVGFVSKEKMSVFTHPGRLGL